METETTDMPITTTSLLTIVVKNLFYLLALAFYPVMNWIISIFPDWKDSLENFKLIGGAIVVLLVIIKLIIEIIKLIKKK